MSTITPREENLKKVIIVDMVQERLHQLNIFGWVIVEYMYHLREYPKNKHGCVLWKKIGNYHKMF
jgi:hypothetical protein